MGSRKRIADLKQASADGCSYCNIIYQGLECYSLQSYEIVSWESTSVTFNPDRSLLIVSAFRTSSATEASTDIDLYTTEGGAFH